jgi:hypothetical protein
VWVEYRTPEGKPYYHCPATNKTAWEIPPGGTLRGKPSPPAQSDAVSGKSQEVKRDTPASTQTAYKPVVWGPGSAAKQTQSNDLLDLGGTAAAVAKQDGNVQNAPQQGDLLDFGGVSQPASNGNQQNASQPLDLLDLDRTEAPAPAAKAAEPSAFSFTSTPAVSSANSSAFSFVGNSAPQAATSKTGSGGYNNSTGGSAFGFINQPTANATQSKAAGGELDLGALYASTANDPLSLKSAPPKTEPTSKAKTDFGDLDIFGKPEKDERLVQGLRAVAA